MNLAAPIEELEGWVSQIARWFAEYQALDSTLVSQLAPMIDQTVWKGDFADAFTEKALNDMVGPFRPALEVVLSFLEAVQAIIHSVEEMLATLQSSINRLSDSIL